MKGTVNNFYLNMKNKPSAREINEHQNAMTAFYGAGASYINFTRRNKYYSKSDCGKYTISASFNGEIWKFSAWYRNDLLDIFTDSELAETACLNHKNMKKNYNE